MTGCPQQVVRVVLVDFGERHRHTDKRAALHRSRPPADQSGKRARKLDGKSCRARHARLVARMSGVSASMSRGCYEADTRKRVPWNLSQTGVMRRVARICLRQHGCLGSGPPVLSCQRLLVASDKTANVLFVACDGRTDGRTVANRKPDPTASRHQSISRPSQRPADTLWYFTPIPEESVRGTRWEEKKLSRSTDGRITAVFYATCLRAAAY